MLKVHVSSDCAQDGYGFVPDSAIEGRKFEHEDHIETHAATEHLVLFAVTMAVQNQVGA